ncbi:MAG: winged helix-turn-helix transcriptional regulator [Nitrososphaerota archaeon]|nr:winged helix-turn-helix transcriptional regulator [Nitrososphaerota archaeon]
MMLLEEFDKATIIRVTLFLLKNPHSHITKIINHTNGKQKAVYTAIAALNKAQYLNKTQNTIFPYNPEYTLTEKGEQLAKILITLKEFMEKN